MQKGRLISMSLTNLFLNVSGHHGRPFLRFYLPLLRTAMFSIHVAAGKSWTRVKGSRLAPDWIGAASVTLAMSSTLTDDLRCIAQQCLPRQVIVKADVEGKWTLTPIKKSVDG